MPATKQNSDSEIKLVNQPSRPDILITEKSSGYESKPRPKANSPQDHRRHAICGAVAGVISKMLLQPLDLIRTRFQVHDGRSGHVPKYRNTLNALSTIVKNEGPAGLYAGALPNVFGSGVAWGIYFLSYTTIKDRMRAIAGRENLSQGEVVVSSILSSSLVMLITNPIWFVKTRMQLQSKFFTSEKVRYKSALDAVFRIYREEGAAAFYRGIGPALSLTSTGAIQMLLYENMRGFVTKRKIDREKLSTATTLTMGGLAKAVAATMTYPVMLIKSRLYQRSIAVENIVEMKHKYKDARHVAAELLRHEGPRAFYKGLFPHLLKTAPSSAITFSCYEYLIWIMSVKW